MANQAGPNRRLNDSIPIPNDDASSPRPDFVASGKGRVLRRSGFTLIEMLTAMTVLSMLVLMMSALMNGASLTIASSNKRLSADDQARLVFDRMQMDFSRMQRGSDIYFQFTKQTGNDQFTFYSETPGTFTGSPLPAATAQSNLSLISYDINSSYQLERLSQGCQWSDISFSPTTAPTVTGTPHVLSNSVFRMEIAFLQHTTDYPPTVLITSATPTPGTQAFQNVYAVIVAIAVLDSNSQKRITTASYSYPKLIAALPDYTGSQTIALNSTSSPNSATIDPMLSTWQTEINSANFATDAGLPVAAAQQVRIYQRIIYLQ